MRFRAEASKERNQQLQRNLRKCLAGLFVLGSLNDDNWAGPATDLVARTVKTGVEEREVSRAITTRVNWFESNGTDNDELRA